jgi:hypothetical protein
MNVVQHLNGSFGLGSWELGIHNRLLLRCGWKDFLWCGGEIGVLDGGRTGSIAIGNARDLLARLADHSLSLLSVFSNIRASSLGGTSGVLRGEILDLACLLANDVTSMLNMRIDDLLVFNVDKGCEVYGCSEDEAETPKWKPLDEVVGDE